MCLLVTCSTQWHRCGMCGCCTGLSRCCPAVLWYIHPGSSLWSAGTACSWKTAGKDFFFFFFTPFSREAMCLLFDLLFSNSKSKSRSRLFFINYKWTQSASFTWADHSPPSQQRIRPYPQRRGLEWLTYSQHSH